MKKILSIFSFLFCLCFVSNVYSNQYCQPHYPQQNCYGNSYVNQCEDPCVGQCDQYPSDAGRFYVGAFGGANWLNFKRHDDIKLKTSTGYMGGASLGYKFYNGFRVEGEVAYRRNQTRHQDIRGDGYEKARISGDTSSWSYMGNVLYDFDGFSSYCPNIVPYVGMGIGYIDVHAHVKGRNDVEHAKVKIKNSGMAGQAIAGVSYRLTDSTSVGLEYRYLLAREHAREHSVGIALRQSF